MSFILLVQSFSRDSSYLWKCLCICQIVYDYFPYILFSFRGVDLVFIFPHPVSYTKEIVLYLTLGAFYFNQMCIQCFITTSKQLQM